MSYEVDEQTLRQFMEKHYPKYKDNLSLARILYAKHVGALAQGMPIVNTTKLRLMKGMRVQLEGVIAGVRIQEYEACVSCKRSKTTGRCQCGSTESVTRYVVSLRVMDNYGEVVLVSWRDDVNGIDESLVGREILAWGIVEEDEDGFKLLNAEWRYQTPGGASEVVSPSKDAVDEVLRVLAIAKYMSLEVFQNLLRERGLSLDDVSGLVEIREGRVYPKGGADGS